MRLPHLLLALLTSFFLSTTAGAQAPQTTPDPASAKAYALQQAGNFPAAIEAWRAALEKNAQNGLAHVNLGYCLHADGQLEAAAKAHARAAQFPPFAARANYNLGCARALLGEHDAAFEALEQALAAGFKNVSLLKSDADLASLRDDARFAELIESANDPLARALHFWVGKWDCYSATTGKLNGRNELIARVGDNVLHEIWTPVGGGPNGESWNYFEPNTRTWRQHWVIPGAPPISLVGKREGKGILFEGPNLDGQLGQNRRRMFVRPIGNGRVQQTGTQSSDGGQTWQPRYDLIYVPRGEAFDPASTAGGR